jgi:hypothetical protein
MPPHGVPIVSNVQSIRGLTLAVGMCGQGFMLGIGVGEEVASLALDGKYLLPKEASDTLRFERNFHAGKKEVEVAESESKLRHALAGNTASPCRTRDGPCSWVATAKFGWCTSAVEGQHAGYFHKSDGVTFDKASPATLVSAPGI